MSPVARKLLWLVLILAAAGCSGLDQIDSWPILYTEPETDRFPGKVEFLGPLGEVQWKDSVVQWGFKPFFSVRNYSDIPRDQPAQFKVPFFAPPAFLTEAQRPIPPRSKPGEGKYAHQVQVLFPFYKHEACEPMHRSFLYPLYYNVRGESEPGDWWHYWALFPFYLGGDSAKRGPYHALFPIGGMCKNMLGRDEMDFVLFPLYLHTKSEDKLSDKGPRNSYNFIWPFFNYTSGGGRDGWYFWPLIGRMHREPDPPRWFFLWPFFWYSESPAKGEDDTRSSVFFPFFGWQHKGDMSRLHILWPLYSYARNDKTGRTDHVFLWFVLRLGSGPEYSRFQFWPFYGQLYDEYIHRWYFMWFVTRREWRETDTSYMSGWSVLFLYRSIYEEREARDQGKVSTYRNTFWPLWYYKEDEARNAYFCTLELSPFGPDAEGMERFWSWIWRVFEFEKRSYGAGAEPPEWRSTRALWQAFRYDRDADSSFLRVFPLFTARRNHGEFTSFETLLGLFGFIDKPGARTYRILFVPWTVKRGDR